DVIRARTLLEHGLRIVPQERPKLFACLAAQLMDAYQHEGRYEKAEEALEKAKAYLGTTAKGNIWPAILDAKMLGLCLQKKNFEEARKILDRGIAACSRILHLTWKNYEARYYYESGLLHQAKKLFEENKKAERNLHTDLRGRIKNNSLGMVLVALGDYKAAVKELGEKLGNYKREGNFFGILSTLINLADSYRMLKNFVTAEIHATQAVALAKKTTQGKWLVPAHHALANVYHDSDQFEKTLLEDDRCLASSSVLTDQKEHFQNCLNIWIQKGHCYKELKQFEKAVVHFQTALEAKPDTALLMSVEEGIGESYLLKGEENKGCEHLMKSWHLSQKIPSGFADPFRFTIGRLLVPVLLKRGQKMEADVFLQNLEILSQKNSEWEVQYNQLKNQLSAS
ncbi:MAG: hypothetical protein HY984_01475, partial [Candidatus Magasanikbacteria bacterium]|nr:hypothetical protein [Candidatus Magasanikbacteria bacterium]